MPVKVSLMRIHAERRNVWCDVAVGSTGGGSLVQHMTRVLG